MRIIRGSALVAVLAAAGAFAVGAQASYFNPTGVYDCQVYEAGLGYFTHVDYYKFGRNHTYQVSLTRSGQTLTHNVTSGRYHLNGDRIVASSGLLKRAHEYLLIESTALVGRTNSGHITGLSCELVYPKPPAPATTNPTAPASTPFALGTYSCYQTGSQTDQISGTTSYTSNQVATVTFSSGGTYQKSGNLVPGDWHESGSTIAFTTGVLWESSNQDIGNIYPSGTTMPNAQAPASAAGYTLVIKDTVAGGDPPSQEFSSAEGNESFWYCKQ
jgi:hypothetical protein